jgi:hypothetical protein
MFVVLLLCAVLGTLYLVRLHRKRKLEVECQQYQEEARRRLAQQGEALAHIREKLKDATPHTDSIVVHHFDLDDQGSNLTERFLHALPDAPPIQLHGADLNVIECPDFYSYNIPEIKAA